MSILSTLINYGRFLKFNINLYDRIPANILNKSEINVFTLLNFSNDFSMKLPVRKRSDLLLFEIIHREFFVQYYYLIFPKRVSIIGFARRRPFSLVFTLVMCSHGQCQQYVLATTTSSVREGHVIRGSVTIRR
jgi:hypothetical protein